MTEQDYLSWTRPAAILKCLGPRATRHQCLLFLAACWRRVAAASADRTREDEIALVEKVCCEEASVRDLRDAGFDYTQDRIEEMLFRHDGIDFRSRAFLFTVPSRA